MNIAVCDDSTIDREIMIHLLRNYFGEKSIAYQITPYESGTNLLQDIEEGSFYDIVFLDIFLGGHLGIDIARSLRNIRYKGDIVFSTSSADYAIDSYEVTASGYLLKPHSYDKLCAVLDRILEKYDVSAYEVRRRATLIRIPYHEILYVESSNNKCILHRLGGENYIIYQKLSDIEKDLDDPRFLRCHQSYLVNMNHIQRAENAFTLFNGEIIMIRQKSLKEIRNKYIEYIDSQKKY